LAIFATFFNIYFCLIYGGIQRNCRQRGKTKIEYNKNVDPKTIRIFIFSKKDNNGRVKSKERVQWGERKKHTKVFM